MALGESLLVLLLIAACAFLFFRLQRGLTERAERELTEASEVESALLELMRWLGSPCIVLPLGVIALAMSALAYSGHVNLAIPWWLCAMLGLEALADGLDSLLRKRRPPGPP